MELRRRVKSPVAATPRRICSERMWLDGTWRIVGRREGIEIGNGPGEGDDLRAGRLLFDRHGSHGDGVNEKTMIGMRSGDHEILGKEVPPRRD